MNDDEHAGELRDGIMSMRPDWDATKLASVYSIYGFNGLTDILITLRRAAIFDERFRKASATKGPTASRRGPSAVASGGAAASRRCTLAGPHPLSECVEWHGVRSGPGLVDRLGEVGADGAQVRVHLCGVCMRDLPHSGGSPLICPCSPIRSDDILVIPRPCTPIVIPESVREAGDHILHMLDAGTGQRPPIEHIVCRVCCARRRSAAMAVRALHHAIGALPPSAKLALGLPVREGGPMVEDAHCVARMLASGWRCQEDAVAATQRLLAHASMHTTASAIGRVLGAAPRAFCSTSQVPVLGSELNSVLRSAQARGAIREDPDDITEGDRMAMCRICLDVETHPPSVEDQANHDQQRAEKTDV